MKGSSYDTNDKNIDVSQMSSVLARLVHKIPTYLVKTLGFFADTTSFASGIRFVEFGLAGYIQGAISYQSK